MKKDTNRVGLFTAIDSFLLTPMNLYGIVGNLKEGSVSIGNFVRIPLNSSIAITAKIADIQDIEFSSFSDAHQILLFKDDDSNGEFSEILQAMRIGSENLEVMLSEDD